MYGRHPVISIDALLQPQRLCYMEEDSIKQTLLRQHKGFSYVVKHMNKEKITEKKVKITIKEM